MRLSRSGRRSLTGRTTGQGEVSIDHEGSKRLSSAAWVPAASSECPRRPKQCRAAQAATRAGRAVVTAAGWGSGVRILSMGAKAARYVQAR
jgi:hypothetical protein